MRWLRSSCCAGALVLALGCAGQPSEPRPGAVEIQFVARVGEQPFACSETAKGLGTSSVSAEPLDLRLYVGSLELLREHGEIVPLELTPDDLWQSSQLALLDFEDAKARCQGGSKETNTRVRGRAPGYDDFVGLTFQLGVPPELNHLDLASAAPPLDVPGLWWSWQGGYKYLRADFATAENSDGFLFHLGASGCDGSPQAGYSCLADNLAKITLMGDVRQPIALDVAELFAGVDLAIQPDQESDLVPGCMSSPLDPECVPMLQTLGLADGTQRVFSLP